MKFKISANQIQRAKKLNETKSKSSPPRLLVTETLEPGVYSIISDIDKLHDEKCIYYKVVRKLND